MSGLDDGGVKVDGETADADRIVGRGDQPLDGGEPLDELVIAAAERPAGGKAVDDAVQLVVVPNELGVDGADERAPVELDRDPAFPLERDQSLPDGNTADPQGLGDLILLHTSTGPQDAVEDQAADVERSLLSRTPADHPGVGWRRRTHDCFVISYA